MMMYWVSRLSTCASFGPGHGKILWLFDPMCAKRIGSVFIGV